MATPLKEFFDVSIVDRCAATLQATWGDLDADAFRNDALAGFEDLELSERARAIARAMTTHLPPDLRSAIEIVVSSLGPELENVDPADAAPTGDPRIDDDPMSGFFYFPHNYFLAEAAARDHAAAGAHFDQIMDANYELTKRFTAEFGVRTPLRNDAERALAHLRRWAVDPNVHVRRLVSEGTRTRLPWSFRLEEFRAEPEPVLELLELLKNDPVEYVRRSVANNLNDLAKDHPDRVVEVAQRWWQGADDKRRRLIRHALRTLVKRGDPRALAILGFSVDSPVSCAEVRVEPSTAIVGDSVVVTAHVVNPSDTEAAALVDFAVHFVKASGSTSAKVFKGAELHLGPGERRSIRKSISLRQHSTRRHYPGDHRVEVMINGVERAAQSFTVVDASSS